MLVECLVATILLSATALVVASLARAVAAGRERAILTAHAWALSVRDIEAATATASGAACAPGTTSGRDALPQLISAWTERTNGATREHDATVLLTTSPLSGGATSQLVANAAWSCP